MQITWTSADPEGQITDKRLQGFGWRRKQMTRLNAEKSPNLHVREDHIRPTPSPYAALAYRPMKFIG